MLEQLYSFIEDSETIKEARINPPIFPLFKEILVLLFSFILLIVLWATLTMVFTNGLSDGTDEYVLVSHFSFFITIILSILFVAKIEKRNLRSMGFSKDNMLSSILQGAVIGFFMFVTIILVGVLLGQYTFAGIDFTTGYLAILYLMSFAVQSFGEEIYTRGWIMTSVSRRHSVFMAILFSSFLFTVLHLGNRGINIIGMSNLLLSSITISVMFLRFDNIWICGAFHTIWNYTQSYLLGFNVSGTATSSLIHFNQQNYNLIGGSVFGPESSLITTIITVIVLLALIYYPKKSGNP